MQVNEVHIFKAVEVFRAEGYPIGFCPSASHYVEIDCELYPPKAVMAYAKQLASGKPPMNDFRGGRETDCYDAFARNGFRIHPKVKANKESNEKNLSHWIQRYKKLI